MNIEVENIPPNSTIEFYNSSTSRCDYSILNDYKPKKIKIIKVCNKIVKFKFQGDMCIKYRTIRKEDLKYYLHYTCYKIY
jgi:hypothetical protein